MMMMIDDFRVWFRRHSHGRRRRRRFCGGANSRE